MNYSSPPTRCTLYAPHNYSNYGQSFRSLGSQGMIAGGNKENHLTCQGINSGQITLIRGSLDSEFFIPESVIRHHLELNSEECLTIKDFKENTFELSQSQIHLNMC